LTSDQVTAMEKPVFARIGHGAIMGTKCAVEPHLRAKCDFGFVQGIGDALLFSVWFQLRRSDGGWSVVAICRGASSRVNPLCPNNDLHLGA
jgi:hypothetical protein